MEVTSFNATWTVLVLGLAGAGVGIHYLLRGRSFAVKRGWLFALALVTLATSIAFHLAYLLDPPPEGFPLLQNLPLHLCTIMSFLMPFVVWFDWKPLRAVAFFPGAIAGIASLVSAASYEQGHSLFDPKSFFWVAHELNAIVPFLLVSLGLYRPTWRQALLSVVWVSAFGLVVILPLDLAMRAWVDPGVNYFYLFDPEGADILVALWEIIPVPIIYMLPVPILVIPVLFLELGVYRLLRGRRTGGVEPAAMPA